MTDMRSATRSVSSSARLSAESSITPWKLVLAVHTPVRARHFVTAWLRKGFGAAAGCAYARHQRSLLGYAKNSWKVGWTIERNGRSNCLGTTTFGDSPSISGKSFSVS